MANFVFGLNGGFNAQRHMQYVAHILIELHVLAEVFRGLRLTVENVVPDANFRPAVGVFKFVRFQ